MKHITLFENWNTQIQPSVASDRPLRKLSELGIKEDAINCFDIII
jgi:hypothetical protein